MSADASAQLAIGLVSSKISNSTASAEYFNSGYTLTLSGAISFKGNVSSPILTITDADVTFQNEGRIISKCLTIKGSTINGVGQVATISAAFDWNNDNAKGAEKFKDSQIEITGSTLYFDPDIDSGNANSTVLGNSETIDIVSSKIYNVVSTGSLGCFGGLFSTLSITGSEVHAQSDQAAAIGPHSSAYSYFGVCSIEQPSITISDSVIEAVSKFGSAIGMPRLSSSDKATMRISICIEGASNVTATSVRSAAIGGAYYGQTNEIDGGIEAEIDADINGDSRSSLLSLWDGLVRLLAGDDFAKNIASNKSLMNFCTLAINGAPTINAKSGILAVYAQTVTMNETNLVQNTLVTKESDGFEVYPMETPGEVRIGSALLGSIGYGYASVATTNVAALSNQTMRFGDAPLADATNDSTNTFSVGSTGFQQFFTTPRLSLSGTVKLVNDSGDAEVTGSAAVGTTLKAGLSELLPSAASKSNSLSYAWYRDGAKVSNASESTYALTIYDSDKVVYCVVSGTGSFAGSVTSNAVTVSGSTTIKAPALENRTANSITLASGGTGYQYMLVGGSGSWQESATFSGLTPFTAYSFVQKNSDNSISDAVTIYTLPNENDFVIDYVNETLSFPSGVNLYSDAECSDWLNQFSSTTRIKISSYIASAGNASLIIYACYSKADYAVPISIPTRPSASVPEPTNVTSNVISFTGEAGVTYRLLAGGNVVGTKTLDSDGNVSFDGLSPATDYSLQVRKEASNEGGGNFASAWSEEKTVTTKSAAPDEPTLSVKAAYVDEGYESVRVGLSWTTPADNGSTITGYALTVKEDGASEVAFTVEPINPDTTFYELTTSSSGLTPGKTYSFVLSVNCSGGEAVSSSTESCTLPNLKPNPSQFTINYVDETITVPANVHLYSDSSCFDKLKPLSDEQNVYSLTDYIASPGDTQMSIYARYSNVFDSSALTEVKVPGRTNCSAPTASTTYEKIEIYYSGRGYSLSLNGEAINPSSTSPNWITYRSLTPDTEYTLTYWQEATATSFKSTVGTTTITTMSLEVIECDVLASVNETSRTYDLSSIIDSCPTSCTYQKTGDGISDFTLSSDCKLSVRFKTHSSASIGTITYTGKINGAWYRFTFSVTAVDVIAEDDGVFWVRSDASDEHMNLLADGDVLLDEFSLTPRSVVGGGMATGSGELTVSWNPDNTVQADLGTVDVSVYRVDGNNLIDIGGISASSNGVDFKVNAAGDYVLAYRRVDPVLTFSVTKDGQDVTELQYGDEAVIALNVNVDGQSKSPTGNVKAYAGDSSSDISVELGTSNLPNNREISFTVGDSLMQLGDGQQVTIEYEGDSNYLPFSVSNNIQFKAAIPSKPALTASEVVEGSVVLSWGAPSANGSEITGYTLNMTKDGASVEGYPASIEVGTTSKKVDGLEPGSTYTFALRANNDVGSSDAGTVEVFGGKVKYGIAISAGIQNGRVESELDSAFAGDLISLQVTPNTGYRISSVSYCVGETSTDIFPSDDGKYAFEMPASSVTVSATFEAIPPAAPSGLAATPGKRSVELTWETSSAEPAVDHYELVVTRDGSSEHVATIDNIASSARTHTVGDLEPGATYDFALAAVTEAGGKASSNVTTAVLAEYEVSVDNNIAGGKVTASPDSAVEGETVTVTATPNEDYELESVTYSHDNETQMIEPNDGVYTFQMPAAPVTVSAVFVAIQGGGDVTIDPAPGGGGGSVVENPDPVTYGVTVTCGEGGTATSNVDSAAEGDVVAVTVTSNAGYEVASVTVSHGDTVEDVSGEKGVYSFEMPSEAVVVSVSFRITGEGNYSDLPYTDVTVNDWFIEPVAYVYRRGIMTGYAGTSLFGPTDSLGREQAAQVLYNALGNGAKAPACPLVDVDQSAWYADAVNWAYDEGLLTGYGDGSHEFGIDEPLTREQFAAIIARVAGANLDDVDTSVLERFSDTSDVPDWSRTALAWAVQNGVLNGSEAQDGTLILRASADINRAEMAQMIMNASEAGLLNLG